MICVIASPVYSPNKKKHPRVCVNVFYIHGVVVHGVFASPRARVLGVLRQDECEMASRHGYGQRRAKLFATQPDECECARLE